MNTRAEDLPAIEATMAGIHAANQVGHQVAYQASHLQADGIEPILVAVCDHELCMAAVVVQTNGDNPQFVDDATFLYSCGGDE